MRRQFVNSLCPRRVAGNSPSLLAEAVKVEDILRPQLPSIFLSQAIIRAKLFGDSINTVRGVNGTSEREGL